MTGIEKKYDIVFAGEIWNSDKRKRLLSSVINHFSDKRICVVGRYKIIEKGFFAWLFREHREIYTNTTASATQLNLLYNQAQVVLNIHVEQQKNGANPKVYEILASGAHEICDVNPYIQEHFGDIIDLYSTEEQMLSLIQEALSSPNVSSEKYVSAIKGNTFIDRIREVLANL
jgi:spore maturation protein CgeB